MPNACAFRPPLPAARACLAAGLLKGKGSEGITIALLERAHEGLNIGRRHDPLSTAFMNGPLSGEGVFVPMACLLGGQERAGYGWNMLMECLAEGRGISLPALSVGAAQTASNAVGAYARVRKQFKVPIAELEGVQEQLAAIASSTYRMNACQALMNGILNAHEQPPVLSAIMKYQMTARMRSVVNQAMDILGGAGICKGKANFMGNSYQQIPIGITVEGANILTRSLIVFGQGLNRSHPNLLGLIESINKGDDMRGFNQHLARLVGHAATNAVGAVGGALATALRAPFGKGADVAAYHEVQLGRLARAFAISADLSLVLGGKLKFAEMLSGRFADVLGNLYSGYAMLHYHKTHHCADSDKARAASRAAAARTARAPPSGVPLVRTPTRGPRVRARRRRRTRQVLDHAMSELLYETQQSLFAIQANFPVPGIGLLMRALTFPLGGSYAMPSDRLNQQVSALITTDSQVRKLLSPNIFISRNDPNDRIALINRALPKVRHMPEVARTDPRVARQPLPSGTCAAPAAALGPRLTAARAGVRPVFAPLPLCGPVPRGGRDPCRRAQGQARAHQRRAGGHQRGRGDARRDHSGTALRRPRDGSRCASAARTRLCAPVTRRAARTRHTPHANPPPAVRRWTRSTSSAARPRSPTTCGPRSSRRTAGPSALQSPLRDEHCGYFGRAQLSASL